jgi:hypothetical protein
MALIDIASPRTLCLGIDDLSSPESGVSGSKMTLDALLVDSVWPPLASSLAAVERTASGRYRCSEIVAEAKPLSKETCHCESKTNEIMR